MPALLSEISPTRPPVGQHRLGIGWAACHLPVQSSLRKPDSSDESGGSDLAYGARSRCVPRGVRGVVDGWTLRHLEQCIHLTDASYMPPTPDAIRRDDPIRLQTGIVPTLRNHRSGAREWFPQHQIEHGLAQCQTESFATPRTPQPQRWRWLWQFLFFEQECASEWNGPLPPGGSSSALAVLLTRP